MVFDKVHVSNLCEFIRCFVRVSSEGKKRWR